MKRQKMSLANIEGKLSREEMKKIMAGSGNCPIGKACWNAYRAQMGFCVSGVSCLCNAGGAGVHSYDCDGYIA